MSSTFPQFHFSNSAIGFGGCVGKIEAFAKFSVTIKAL
jgi:hypothetical protein